MFKLSKILILIFLNIIFTLSTFAKIDIIEKIEKLSALEDISKIKQLFDISVYYFIQDDSTNFHKYGSQALELAKVIKSKELEIDALNNLAFAYSYDDKKISSNYANYALNLAIENNYNNGIGFSYFILAYTCPRSEYAKKIDYYFKSIDIAKKLNNELLLAYNYTYLGEIYTKNDNISEAIKFMIDANKIFEKNTNINTIQTQYIYGELLGYLGITYKKSNKLKDAEKYYNFYKENSNKIDNFYGEAFAINNLGNIYYNEKKYNEAIKCYLDAKEIWEKHNVYKYIGSIYNNLANIYFDMKEMSKVEEYYKLALDFCRKYDDYGLEAQILCNLADLRVKQGKFKEAEKFYLSSLVVNKDKLSDILIYSYSGLADVYDSLKMISESYRYYKLFNQLKDSVNQIAKIDELAVLSEKYKNEKIIEDQKMKSLMNEKLEVEKQQRKYNLEYLAILIFILFVFSIVFFVGKFNISVTKIETMVFLALILLFEFIQVFFDPYINKITGGEPIYNLMLNMLIALMLTPIDTYSEKVLRRKRK